jgi:hypothetical protein
MRQMGMGLPDNRREADSSYCAKALEAWSWWVSLPRPSSFQKYPHRSLRLIAMEAAMQSFWHGVIALFGQTSFALTVLFVVGFACLLALVFEASIEIIFTIVVLGGFTAITEQVMHSRNITVSDH